MSRTKAVPDSQKKNKISYLLANWSKNGRFFLLHTAVLVCLTIVVFIDKVSFSLSEGMHLADSDAVGELNRKVSKLSEMLEVQHQVLLKIRADNEITQKTITLLETENAAIQKQLSAIAARINPAANLSDPMAIQRVKANDKKMFLMKIKLNRVYNETGKYPQTVEEFANLMGNVPLEDQSQSSRVSLDKDFKGGWFYDRNTGNIAPNVD